MVNSDGFENLFCRVLSDFTEDQFRLFATMSWSIWKMRNNKLWDSVQETADQVVQLAI